MRIKITNALLNKTLLALFFIACRICAAAQTDSGAYIMGEVKELKSHPGNLVLREKIIHSVQNLKTPLAIPADADMHKKEADLAYGNAKKVAYGDPNSK